MFFKIKFDTIESTNKYAKDNYYNLTDKTVIIANHQTLGRGRLGRTWSDNDDVLLSIVLKNDLKEELVSKISMVACYSLLKLFKEYNVMVKWPNDILINNKKVVGILTESIYTTKIECVILGIGINCNTTKYDEELEEKATSLYLLKQKRVDKDKLINKFLKIFEKDYQEFINESDKYIEYCNKKSIVNNKKIYITKNNETKEVEAIKILENGNLLVKNEDNFLEEVFSFEVSLKNNYNI